MKIARTVILVLAILVSIFFVIYANIQTSYAMENLERANMVERDAMELAKQAEKEAANAREAEARALAAEANALQVMNELEECRNSK